MNLIYGLTDPRTGAIRYIGKSSSGMRRPQIHAMPSILRDPSHKTRWILSLHRAGLTYGILALAHVDAAARLNDEERLWIRRGRSAGWPLTNSTDGGDGQSKGYRTSEATKLKLSAIRKGRVMPPEIRLKISRGVKELWKCPDFRAKRIAAERAKPHIQPPHSAAALAKISAASKASWATGKNRSSRAARGIEALRRATAARVAKASDPAHRQAMLERQRTRNKLWMRNYSRRVQS